MTAEKQMKDSPEEVIRRASKPLSPKPTSLQPRLPQLEGIRAVLFDIYGTLIISGSGDIGAADPTIRGQAFSDALQAVGVEYRGDPEAGARILRELIDASHAKSRDEGIDFPEIDIVAVWQSTYRKLEAGSLITAGQQVDLEQLATEFEVRTNPVWPMPGLVDCLGNLRDSGRVLGIISNAQFFTPAVFPALAGETL
ncbi:MAG: HAD family hydrolase, partial [Lacipirellulaceae bacterium]